MIYLCLRETIRLTLPGTYFRRNVSNDEIPIPGSPGYVIPGKGYVAMAVGDMHHNPSIFKDSDEWDPSRYFPDRAEDKKQTYAWTGWGQGRYVAHFIRRGLIADSLNKTSLPWCTIRKTGN